MDKRFHANVKDDNGNNARIVLGSQRVEPNEETNTIIKEGISITSTDGLDGISSMNSKVDNAYHLNLDTSRLSLSRPKSTWTRIN